MNNNIENHQVIESPKTKFIENIRKWVLIDGQLKIINDKTRKLRDIKHNVTTDICSYMTENNLTDKKIGITDGELKVYEKKEYSPLSYGYIEKCLAEIIPDKTKVDFIIQYLKEHREITTSQDIRRYAKS